jgi:signal transduction histidine kinase
MDLVKKLLENQLSAKKLINLFWAAEISLALVLISQIYNQSFYTSLGVLVIAVSLISVYFFAKKGRVALGGNILLFFLSMMIISFMWLYEGIRDEVLLLFPCIIMFSIHIGSRKFALFLYILTTINVFLITYFNHMGYIVHTQNGSTLGSAFTILVILSVTAYSVWLIATDMYAANSALIQNQEELENKVQERTEKLQNTIDNLNQAQKQLIESEKMASLGRLVAGVAHEINNPLGIAITASSHLESSTKEFSLQYRNNTLTKKCLEKQLDISQSTSTLISNNLAKAANLVQSFKDVSVDQTSNKKRKFNIKNYINEVIVSLGPKLRGTQYSILVQCEDDLVIFSKLGDFSQILTNLVINALIHAFDNAKKGDIIITIKKSGEFLKLIFDDNGNGMSPETREKIFEPFFTTKRGSGGSGLGMHMVYNLVTQSLNGTITCSSTLGQGTQFEIIVPYDE